MRVDVLGPLRVTSSEVEVPAGPPKQRALLALLAMHAGRVLPVDTIVDRLWGEAPPASAHNSLQVYVSNLRKVLEPARDRSAGPTVLVSAAGGYGLVDDDLDLDVRELDRLLQSARELAATGRHDQALAGYDAALALWRGDAYADVRGEEWAAAELARLAELHSTVVEERSEALLALDRPADVVGPLEALVAGEPLRERAWELLATAHVRMGRQAAALEALRRARAALADELGIDPGPRLQQLELAVLRQEPLPRPASRPAERSEVFVGREPELAALEQARRDSRSGSVVVLVDGEPGLGKSTLVRRFAGETAVWGRHPDHEVAPALWSWQQVLSGVARDRPSLQVPDSVARLLDGSGAALRAHEAEGARLRFFDDVVDVLRAAAPLEVVLDDLHAADSASLRLLEHVAATRVRGLLVVATYRTHEAASLGPTLAALARTGSRRLALEGLSPEAVRALVAGVSGEEPEAAEAARLQERTGGNPFFVVEVARSNAEVPDAVRDVVLHRIDALGPETAGVLEAAAVVGDHVESWLVAEVAGTTPDATARALDRAYDAGLVRDDPTGPGHEFAHALVVDALLGRHSRAWRAVRHERCALALTRAHGGREDRLATIARHWLAAADLGPDRALTAADFCARASRAALARHAPEEAIPLAQEAVAAGEVGGATDSERLELTLTLARACYAAGRYDDGYAAALAALATGEPDPEQVVAVADVVMADAMWPPFHATADPTPLEVALDEAVARLGPGTPAWSLGQACRAVIMAVTGREADIEATSDAAVSAAAAQGDLLTRVLHLQLVSMRGPDFVERRAEVSRRLRARPGVPPTLVLVADLHLASHEVEHGRAEVARHVLPDLLRRAEALRDPVLIRQVTQMQVAFLVFEGHHDEALATMAEVAARTPSVDPRYFQAAEATLHVLVALERDGLTEMAPLLELVHAETRMSGFGYILGLAVVGTDPQQARRLLAAAPPARDYTWGSSTLVRLRLAIALDDRTVIEECAALFAPFSGQLLVNGTCTCVIGAYDGHLGEAALALGRVAEARRHLEDAVALLEANGAAYWLERARQVLAKCP